MKEAAWLEVSLVVDGEMAEAVAEVLARFTSGGAAIESTGVTAGAEDEGGQAVGPLRVRGYLPAGPNLEQKRLALEQALWYLGRIRPLPEAAFTPVQEENWAEAWKQHYRPVSVGRRLVIVPAWMEPPDDRQEGDANLRRIPVRIDPGMAFGTGAHPTTQLCLELVEEAVERSLRAVERSLRLVERGLQEGRSSSPEGPAHPGSRAVIDVGCGSGILAIAGLKLGLERALGVDLDPQAVEAARGNALTNQVSDRLELGAGSVEEIREGRFSIREAGLVVANILAPVIARLFGEGLGELVLPGGWLVASGILDEQAGEVIAAAEAQGLRPVERRQQGDWAALVFERDIKKT